MNEAMRLIGSDEYEQIWQSKLYTFGPFCLLLWSNPFNDKSIEKVETVYRGIILSPTEIDSFKNDYSRNFKAEGSFQAFTSCTRNRTLAEMYGGNALLIMTVRYGFTVDLAPFSQYPQEEEVLVFPGVYFTVERMDFDKDKNKHLIYLNLRHKLAGKPILCLLYIFSSGLSYILSFHFIIDSRLEIISEILEYFKIINLAK
jgi:hypothetical protein